MLQNFGGNKHHKHQSSLVHFFLLYLEKALCEEMFLKKKLRHKVPTDRVENCLLGTDLTPHFARIRRKYLWQIARFVGMFCWKLLWWLFLLDGYFFRDPLGTGVLEPIFWAWIWFGDGHFPEDIFMVLYVPGTVSTVDLGNRWWGAGNLNMYHIVVASWDDPRPSRTVNCESPPEN